MFILNKMYHFIASFILWNQALGSISRRATEFSTCPFSIGLIYSHSRTTCVISPPWMSFTFFIIENKPGIFIYRSGKWNLSRKYRRFTGKRCKQWLPGWVSNWNDGLQNYFWHLFCGLCHIPDILLMLLKFVVLQKKSNHQTKQWVFRYSLSAVITFMMYLW